jgi:hypothetical protein
MKTRYHNIGHASGLSYFIVRDGRDERRRLEGPVDAHQLHGELQRIKPVLDAVPDSQELPC